MPQVASSDFSSANQPGGQVVPFQIALTGCTSSAIGSVTVGFTYQPAVGYNDIIKNTGTATGVGVRVFDALKTPISMAGAIKPLPRS